MRWNREMVMEYLKQQGKGPVMRRMAPEVINLDE